MRNSGQLLGADSAQRPELSHPERSLGALCLRFLDEYRRPKIKDLVGYRRTARAILQQRVLNHAIAQREVQTIRSSDFEALRDHLESRSYQNSSINQTLKLLSTMFCWAQRSELLDRQNPLRQVERLPERESGESYSPAEVRRLLSRPDCPAMVVAALYTGMRKGELFGLTWDAVSFDQQCIFVRRSYATTPKSGKPRTVPIHPELRPRLLAWQRQCPATASGLVFPVRKRDGYGMGRTDDGHELIGLLQAAQTRLPLRPWHAFRHTFATLLCEAGVQRDALEYLLGHATTGSRVTARYLHFSVAFLAKELGKLSLAAVPRRRSSREGA